MSIRHRIALTSQALDHVVVLRPLTDVARQSLATRCAGYRYPAGMPILHFGGDDTEVYFLLDGRVRAEMYSPEGRHITFQVLAPGEMFGEMAAIDGQPRSAGITAIDDCTVAQLSARDFRELLHATPAIADACLVRLSDLVRALCSKVYESHAFKVEQRLFAELVRLAETSPAASAPTHADLASRIGTTREAVSRLMARLRELGIVDKAGRRLDYRDLDALRRLAAGHHIA
ncbi:MAG: Crp/Fnr family transcriptional regulator [Ectothiorhodospiraceae bacterium]|nr:Crp/Fnr family transcriptional regulator [Chromatiales bacterium]MCP5157261.1 Crp/Fnr family transcriptional regulator [Ectothiorhodospiraceae bacterium]